MPSQCIVKNFFISACQRSTRSPVAVSETQTNEQILTDNFLMIRWRRLHTIQTMAQITVHSAYRSAETV